MYRIEVKPGEEAVFRTIEELATGIRNGFVTPRARIYHAASQKWLPIEFHPHYKKALEGNFTPAPTGPQPSLAEMPAPTFAFPSAAPPPAPSSAAPNPPASMAEPAPVSTAPSPVRVPSPPPAKAPPTATAAAESPVLAMRAAIGRPQADFDEAEAEGPMERYSPVAVLETPRPAPAVVPMPRPAPAAEVVLPNITYPEVPPMESEQRAPARRSRRAAGRPLLLIGSAAALVLGGQRYLAARGAVGGAVAPMAETAAEAAQPETRPVERKPTPGPKAASKASAMATPPVQVPRRQPAPLVPAPTQRMQPGPAFAASVPASGIASPPPAPPTAPRITPPAPALVPGQAPAGDVGIAPAPSAIELDVPAALPGESIAPAVNDSRDSLALKRILKAVTGRKASPAAP
jgi:hypothetical protein